MTSYDVESIIGKELGAEIDLTDVNGHNLKEWSFAPILSDYRIKTHGTIIGKFWTVFEERPDGQGYYIFFDDKKRVFGLGVKDDDGVMIQIGEYGSFISTLWAM